LRQLQFQVRIAICAANPKLATLCTQVQLPAWVALIAVIAVSYKPTTGCNFWQILLMLVVESMRQHIKGVDFLPPRCLGQYDDSINAQHISVYLGSP
jgi:hypothetical protein